MPQAFVALGLVLCSSAAEAVPPAPRQAASLTRPVPGAPAAGPLLLRRVVFAADADPETQPPPTPRHTGPGALARNLVGDFRHLPGGDTLGFATGMPSFR